jgi:cell wall-associated NlpC family hydrolase
MQNSFFFVFVSLCLIACHRQQDHGDEGQAVTIALESIQTQYAPDTRTDRVAVTVGTAAGQQVLTGYTTVAAAYHRLDSLAESHPELTNEVRLLGQSDSFALVRVSVANIRTRPGHSQELTSQALMGTPVALLLEEDGWCLIRTPDRYLAWLEKGALVPVDRQELASWFSDSLRTCVRAQTAVLSEAGRGGIVSELVAGNLVQLIATDAQGYSEIRLPDGRTGYVESEALQDYTALARPDGLHTESLLATAYTLSGRPYLWGGTSPKGMDCSGFTKTAYYLNGYVIPRDASQQVRAGSDVPLDESFSQLQRGDLLFFGNYREDGSERTTHVGFYLGEGRMLHAGADNGYITENSLLPDDADYAPHRRQSLLRARRLVPGTEEVQPVGEAFRSLYTRSSSR